MLSLLAAALLLSPHAEPPAASPAAPQLQRVGGDLTATVTKSAGTYRASAPNQACLIDTPLPEGYPDPTPPGAIDIKHYPSVRRAEFAGDLTPDIGMNVGFFPLFNHIKARNIAMTSPVEMDYHTRFAALDDPTRDDPAKLDLAAGDPAPQRPHEKAWTMSFLYRSPDLGDTGDDGRIRIVDTTPVTVVALGVRGGYSQSTIDSAVRTLSDWLAANPQWTRDHDHAPRALYYNGPERRNRDKWAEAQLPIKPAPAPAQPTTTPTSPPAAAE